MKRDGPIRLLTVEASPLFNTLLRGALGRRRDIILTPSATGLTAVRDRILAFHPDVIVLDLALTETETRTLLKELRENYPVPILGCAGGGQREARSALKLIQRGLLDVVVKPTGTGTEPIRKLGEELARKILAAVEEARPILRSPSRQYVPATMTFQRAGIDPRKRLIVVGASTGGTEALRIFLRNMPQDSPPIVIVQHMPVTFTASFAEHLNNDTPLRVSEAAEGDAVVSGRVFVARGDTHLTVRWNVQGWYARYTHTKPVNRHCPSVDVLFESAAQAAGDKAVGILLTGMGSDGAHGLLQLHQAGALTVAQSAVSCVVFGMPKVAMQLGAVDLVGAPEEIPQLVIQAMSRRAPSAAYVSEFPRG